MPEGKGSHTAEILLKVALTASVGYVLYDIVTAHFAGTASNLLLFLYLMIVPNLLAVRWVRNKTLRGAQVLCISLLVFVIVLYLTTLPRFWPAVWATLFVALPTILCFILLAKNRIPKT